MRLASIAVVVAVLLAAGCDAGPRTPPAAVPGPGGKPTAAGQQAGAGPAHNAADVAFVQALIPHHQDGIALAAKAAAARPAVRTLAEAIITTQQDEVVRMTAWLREWGQTAPAGAAGAPLRGDPVQALIGHQEAAVRLAQQEQGGGSNRAALDFARQIVESRTAQINQLEAG
jgi:uncharacterized protein (DUF305 family)